MKRPSSTTSAHSAVVVDVPARLDMIAVVRMVADAAAGAQSSLVGDRVDDLRWVVSEAVTNAIKATIRQPKTGRVQMVCGQIDRGLEVTVTDQGPGFLDNAPALDIEHPDRLQHEGGFGIPLMRHLSSSPVRFKTSPAGTTVTLQLKQ